MQITFQAGTRTCTNCVTNRPEGAFVVVMGAEVVVVCEECMQLLSSHTARASRKRRLQKERDEKFGL